MISSEAFVQGLCARWAIEDHAAENLMDDAAFHLMATVNNLGYDAAVKLLVQSGSAAEAISAYRMATFWDGAAGSSVSHAHRAA